MFPCSLVRLPTVTNALKTGVNDSVVSVVKLEFKNSHSITHRARGVHLSQLPNEQGNTGNFALVPTVPMTL